MVVLGVAATTITILVQEHQGQQAKVIQAEPQVYQDLDILGAAVVAHLPVAATAQVPMEVTAVQDPCHL